MVTYQARVAEDGRIEVAPEMLAALGLKPGDRLHVERQAGSLVLKTFADIVTEGQRRFRAMLPADFSGSLVDELIADRRAEAERE